MQSYHDFFLTLAERRKKWSINMSREKNKEEEQKILHARITHIISCFKIFSQNNVVRMMYWSERRVKFSIFIRIRELPKLFCISCFVLWWFKNYVYVPSCTLAQFFIRSLLTGEIQNVLKRFCRAMSFRIDKTGKKKNFTFNARTNVLWYVHLTFIVKYRQNERSEWMKEWDIIEDVRCSTSNI